MGGCSLKTTSEQPGESPADAYIYTGRSIAEAVKNYEADKHVKVNKIVEVK